MTEQEKYYFKILSKDRSDSADMLEKPSMRGIKSSVVEKYSDQAHFIYELLQNADDALATSARFVLSDRELIFAHNGTKRFSISNPATEDEDTAAGQLGDINSITSIANSNKTSSSIGKFGVGFKAVFQYTSTPHIYDPDVFFKIERFIVPKSINDDYIGRKPGETLFVFPFDHADRGPEKAFEDISDKLCSLVYPVLFLTNLKKISFDYPLVSGTYTKNIEENLKFRSTDAELICFETEIGDKLNKCRLWLFSRNEKNGYRYSIGFFLNNDNKLLPLLYPAFCFFPTKEATGLNFILHAPFLLTDSREGIKEQNFFQAILYCYQK